MFKTAEEILAAIKDKEEELASLRLRMEEGFDLYRLTPYEGKAGYESYTSSAPRNFFDKVLDALNRAVLTIQIELPEEASEKEKRAASQGELYLFGALAAIDRRLALRGEPPLRAGLGFFICLRGWVAVRALVYTQNRKETVFDAQPWDPLHLTWEAGPSGLLWAAYKRTASKAQIYAEYEIELKGKETEVVDWWDEESNAVLAGGEFLKPLTPHNIGHPPIFVAPVGSMPTIVTGSGGSTMEDRGDSVWAASRNLYTPHNKQVSNLMDVQKRATGGSLVFESEDGLETIEGDPYGSFRVIPIKRGNKLTGLELPKAPPETAAILGLIGMDIQQSTLPYPLAYGGTQEAMSGRALSVLIDATLSAYTPRTGLMAQVFTWIGEELLGQYATKGLGKAELKGYDKKGMFFTATVKPKDINRGWYLRVKVEPKMPRDKQGDIMAALAATQSRGPGDMPLMSKQTARESGLLLQDPTAERDKILEEMGETLIIPEKIAAALIKRGRPEDAKLVMGKLRGGPQSPALPPELIRAIVEVLVQSGQPQLAEALLKALGVVGPGGAAPGAPTQAALPGEPVPPGQGPPMMGPQGG